MIVRYVVYDRRIAEAGFYAWRHLFALTATVASRTPFPSGICCTRKCVDRVGCGFVNTKREYFQRWFTGESYNLDNSLAVHRKISNSSLQVTRPRPACAFRATTVRDAQICRSSVF